MGKRIRDYVKYTQSELENYTKLPGTCVQKINKKIHINFPPYGLGSMKATLQRIIFEKKIGSYDYELKGIILDVRNIKVLGNLAALRFDDPTLHIDVQADCYVFNPKIGSIVRGLVKHIAAHQISVIIYRVFNVSIRLSTERYDNTSIELNTEIEFRIKSFDLENLMPYIEGELVAREMPLKHIYINVDSDSNSAAVDSDDNSAEDEEDEHKVHKVPKRRKKLTLNLPLIEDSDDEIEFSEIYHLKPGEVKNIENRTTNKVKKNNDNNVEFSESFRLQPDEVEEIEKVNTNVKMELDKEICDNVKKKNENVSKSKRKRSPVPNTSSKLQQSGSSSASSDDSDREQTQSSKIKQMLLKTLKNSKALEDDNIKHNISHIKPENSIDEPNNKRKVLNKQSIELKNTNSSDDENENILWQTRDLKIEKNSEPSENSSSEEEIEEKSKIQESHPVKLSQAENIKKEVSLVETSSSDSEIEFKNTISSTINSKNTNSNKKLDLINNYKAKNHNSSSETYISDDDDAIQSTDNLKESEHKIQTKLFNKFEDSETESSPTKTKINNSISIGKSPNKTSKTIEPNKIKWENILSPVKVKSEMISHAVKNYESEDLFDGISTIESILPPQQRIENKLSESELKITPKKQNINNSINQILNKTIANKINTDSDASVNSIANIKIEPTSTTKRKRKPTSSVEDFSHLVEPVKNPKGKIESPKKKTISESCSVTVSSNKNKSPRKSTISESNSLADSITEIMSRVLSEKNESPQKKTSVNNKMNKKRMTSESNSIDGSMTNMAHILSQNNNSSSVVESKKSTPTKSKSVDDSMANVIEQVLSKKIQEPKKKTARKSTSSESNAVNDTMSDIMARILSQKTETLKIKTPSETSSVSAAKSKAKSSRKQMPSESNSVDNSMSDIMARVLSKKIETPEIQKPVKTSVNGSKRKSPPSVAANDTKVNNKEKNLSGLDSSLAQILAKVQQEKITNSSKNVKKRKISNCDSDKSPTKSSKKPRKSVNFKSEPETDNNQISFNYDSFSVPSLSSTRIEIVKK